MKNIFKSVIVLMAVFSMMLISCVAEPEKNVVILNSEGIPVGEGSIEIRYMRVRLDNGQLGPFINEIEFDGKTYAITQGSCLIQAVDTGSHVLYVRYREGDVLKAETVYHLITIGGENCVIDGTIPMKK